MSTTFERFLAGEDRLSALLQALPAYAPSPALEASFAAAARSAQQAHDTPTQGFEPPASLEASFLKMARDVDAAQATRRDALLGQIAAGEAPAQAVGAPVSPATADWLAAQAAARPPVAPAAPAQAARPQFFGFGWKDLRLVALTAIITSWVGYQYFIRQPSTLESALLDTLRFANEAILEREQDIAGLTSAPQPASPADSAPNVAEAAEVATVTESVTQPPAAPPAAKPVARSLAEVTPAREPAPAQDKATAGAHVEARAKIATANEQTSAEAPHAPRTAAPSALQEAPTPVVATAPVQADLPPRAEMKKDAAPARERESLAAPAAAARPAPAAVAAPAPSVAAAPAAVAAPAPAGAVSAPATLMVSLSDDPQTIVSRLPTRPAGLTWQVYSANPDRREVRDWVGRLQQAIPANQRPQQIRILRDTQLFSDALRIVAPDAP